MKINYQITTAGSDNFIYLTSKLDDLLNQLAGGEAKRKNYIQHNVLKSIDKAIVAYDDYNPIGCISFKEYSNQIAEIKRLFVIEAYRRRGIGKELIYRIEQEITVQNYKQIYLETGLKLDPAINLYKKSGFSQCTNYYPYNNLRHSVCMCKSLEGNK